MSGSPAVKDARLFPRRKVILRGQINVKTFEFRCDLVNLSLGGAMVKLDLPIAPNTSVELEIKSCPPLPAKVIWVKDDKMGLQFTLEPVKVRHALGRLGNSLPPGVSNEAFQEP